MLANAISLASDQAAGVQPSSHCAAKIVLGPGATFVGQSPSSGEAPRGGDAYLAQLVNMPAIIRMGHMPLKFCSPVLCSFVHVNEKVVNARCSDTLGKR